MLLFQNTKIKKIYFYILFLVTALCEYKFLYKSWVPSFFILFLGFFFFYKNIKISRSEVILYSLFGIFFSFQFYFFDSTTLLIKSFRYYFGWLFFIIIFKILAIKINFRYLYYFLILMLVVDFSLINIFHINYEKIYGFNPSFRIFEFYRIAGFTASPSISSAVISALYFCLIRDNHINIFDFISYFVSILIIFSTLGFIFFLLILIYLIYKLNFFNKCLFIFLIFNIILSFFVIYEFKLDRFLSSDYRNNPSNYISEVFKDKFTSLKISHYTVLKSNTDLQQKSYYQELFSTDRENKFRKDNDILTRDSLDSNANSKQFFNIILHTKNLEIQSNDILFGFQNKTGLFMTGGDFSFLNFINSLGLISFFLFLFIILYNNFLSNIPAILLFLSCFHYDTLMSPIGQFFFATFLVYFSNKNEKYF